MHNLFCALYLTTLVYPHTCRWLFACSKWDPSWWCTDCQAVFSSYAPHYHFLYITNALAPAFSVVRYAFQPPSWRNDHSHHVQRESCGRWHMWYLTSLLIQSVTIPHTWTKTGCCCYSTAIPVVGSATVIPEAIGGSWMLSAVPDCRHALLVLVRDCSRWLGLPTHSHDILHYKKWFESIPPNVWSTFLGAAYLHMGAHSRNY